MMGKRGAARAGRERDAVTRWRHVTAWSHVRRSFWKRTLCRRERQSVRRQASRVRRQGVTSDA